MNASSGSISAAVEDDELTEVDAEGVEAVAADGGSGGGCADNGMNGLGLFTVGAGEFVVSIVNPFVFLGGFELELDELKRLNPFIGLLTMIGFFNKPPPLIETPLDVGRGGIDIGIGMGLGIAVYNVVVEVPISSSVRLFLVRSTSDTPSTDADVVE